MRLGLTFLLSLMSIMSYIRGLKISISSRCTRGFTKTTSILMTAISPQRHSLPDVYFVLGGPGAGKGTQCGKLSSEYGLLHLSAGELLREERRSGSNRGEFIETIIKEGRIVPSEITVELIKAAIDKSEASKILGISN